MAVFAPDLLTGKRILITGGGTGLGRGVARHLVEHGAAVHLWGRRPAVLQEAAEHSGATAHQTVDVRDGDAVDDAMGALWAEHGPLAGVINNAAANFIAPTESLSPRAFEAVSSTVMKGSFHTTHAAGRRWIAGGLPGVVCRGRHPGRPDPDGPHRHVEELANLTMFLLSDACPYLTGQTIAMDGGRCSPAPAPSPASRR